jgi:hypothetical protein
MYREVKELYNIRSDEYEVLLGRYAELMKDCKDMQKMIAFYVVLSESDKRAGLDDLLSMFNALRKVLNGEEVTMTITHARSLRTHLNAYQSGGSKRVNELYYFDRVEAVAGDYVLVGKRK